jgi:uncharacterized protein YkwD
VISIKRSLAAFVLAAAVVASSVVPLAEASAVSANLAPRTRCRGQASTAASVAVQTRAMRCLINWARHHNGRAILRDQVALDHSASLRGNDILRCNDFSHTPCGQPFLLVFTIVNYLTGTGSVGENLAWAEGRRGSARATMVSWLTSPEHRQILFTTEWRDLGVSLVRQRSMFGLPNVSLWVAQFGHRPTLPVVVP